LNGTKGEYSDKWRNAPINGVTVVDPNAQAGAAEAVPEAMPEVAPEAAEVTPEAPPAREPSGSTILGDEERQVKIKTMTDRSNLAKNIVETGRLPGTQDAWGNEVPGQEVSPEQLIPMYVAELAKLNIEGFSNDEWTRRFMTNYQDGGREGLISSITSAPILLKHFI
jgi:hypothetical protein